MALQSETLKMAFSKYELKKYYLNYFDIFDIEFRGHP